MRNILIALIILIVNSCRFEQNNKVDVCATFDKIDAKIVALINEIQVKHKSDRPFLDAFNMEQVYWVQYRDRRLRAMYPKKWDQHYRKNNGKKVFNPCKCQELLRLSERRIEDLKMYLIGGPADQQDCPSKLNE